MQLVKITQKRKPVNLLTCVSLIVVGACIRPIISAILLFDRKSGTILKTEQDLELKKWDFDVFSHGHNFLSFGVTKMTKVWKWFYFLWTFRKTTSCYPKTQQKQQKQHFRSRVSQLVEFTKNRYCVFVYKAHPGALPASYMH